MKKKSNGNGQGSVYKRGNTWEAQVVTGWVYSDDPEKKPYPVKKRKNFKTKAEAKQFCANYDPKTETADDLTLKQVYDDWEKSYAPRVGESTMACYKSAFKHFEILQNKYINLITALDLQKCLDQCKSGKRTHQNMKVTAGLIWAYALDAELVDKDVTRNLYIGKGETKQREPLTDAEIKKIKSAIGKEMYADYIYALCYLGFRPGEYLNLKKEDLHKKDNLLYLVGGGKTDAGRDRIVPVPDTIREFIEARAKVDGTDYLFPMYCYSRKKEFTGFKKMTDAYFRESVFKPMMTKLGIAEGKVPYSTRHTYSDKLKNADGFDKAKAALMGHTNYDFTKEKYQSTTLEELQEVVKSLK